MKNKEEQILMTTAYLAKQFSLEMITMSAHVQSSSIKLHRPPSFYTKAMEVIENEDAKVEEKNNASKDPTDKDVVFAALEEELATKSSRSASIAFSRNTASSVLIPRKSSMAYVVISDLYHVH